jgi:hypothetical protein
MSSANKNSANKNSANKNGFKGFLSSNRLSEIPILECPNKKSYIQKSKSNDTFNMNNQNGKYMILAHGSILQGYNFRIPKNINFITLTTVGCNIPTDYRIDREIQSFYKRGKTLFQNNDLEKELTEEGDGFLKQLQLLYPSLDFKNHLGGSIANEMFLNFTRNGSKEGNFRAIGIIDLSKNSNKPKNIANLNNESRRTKINQILLSSLLTMYDEKLIKNSKGIKKIFIIRACRGFQEGYPSAAANFAGFISNQSPLSRNGNSNKINSS